MGFGAGETFERYTIEELIGRGGMGEVYRALDTRLLRKVAIKVVRPDRTTDWNEAIARLFREARAAAAITHPNAVAIYDLGQVDSTFFLVMELVRGRMLRHFVGDASVPIETRLKWLGEIGRALAAAHEAGVVHRDVKPGNIMITTTGIAKVLDFGLAKPVDDPSGFKTKVGHLLGTLRYMSPEQREGAEADARSDQFAFGLTAYELLSGIRPDISEKAPEPPLPVPGVPSEVSMIIARTLSNDPRRRFPGMANTAQALEVAAQWLSGAPSSRTVRETTMPPPKPKSSIPPDGGEDVSVTEFDVALPDLTAELTTNVRGPVDELRPLVRAFADGFEGFTLGTAGYSVELSATDGAVGSLALVPGQPEHNVMVAGFVNIAHGSAELRTFDHVLLLYAQATGKRPAFDRAAYEGFVGRVQAVLRKIGITSYTLVAPPQELVAAMRKAPKRE